MNLKQTVIDFIEHKEAEGWTGQKLAEFFDTTAAQVGKWKKGDACPTTDSFERVAAETGTSVEETQSEDSDAFVDFPEANMIILRPSWKGLDTLSYYAEQVHHKKFGNKLGLDIKTSTGSHKAKNTLLTSFLERKDKPTWALVWDDDMIPPFGNATVLQAKCNAKFHQNYASTFGAARLLERAQKHNLTIIAGLYRARGPRKQHRGKEMMYAEGQENMQEGARARKAPFNEYKQVKWAGMGFMLIHREALENMVERVPDVKSKIAGVPHNFVTPVAGNKDMLSTSSAFCARALKAGHKTYVDFSVPVGHVGDYIYWPDSEI